MLFNSFAFAIFFPIVTALYFMLPHRARWILLLAASCVFYMAFVPAYILILAFTIVVDFVAGILIESAEGRKRRWYLIASIVSNVAVLAFFKYFNFFNANVYLIASLLHWNYSIASLKILLPIGLSFHTFQAMSYTIEVYRRHQKAERHFGIYALYVMFYPQLVAGPIERPQNLLHQFKEKHELDYQRMADGLKLMAWGLFKKIVIADRLAMLVGQVYDNPTHYTGLPLWIATYLFAFQVFCDFSGYSDIAIGAAQVMGFKLMNNFTRPFYSKSIPELWKRWHISLSSWFRDYLYIPLGGNRVSKLRWYFNMFFVFAVSGLWHGANWNFVLWGVIQGVYLVLSAMTKETRATIRRITRIERYPTVLKFVQILTTFHLFIFPLMIFRAGSVRNGIYILTHLFVGLGAQLTHLNLPFDPVDLLLGLAMICVLELAHLAERRGSVREQLKKRQWYVRWPAYYALGLLIVLFAQAESQQFIYFQF